jgi:hypothetical protein
MKKCPQKRLIPLVLTASLLFAALSAEIFIFTHFDHDCCGLDCPVCLQIQTAQNILKELGLAFAAIFLIGFAFKPTLAAKRIHYYCGFPATPIFLNVKSNT